MLRWMSSATLQDAHSVEPFFTVAEVETLALFEHLHSRNSKDGKFNYYGVRRVL